MSNIHAMVANVEVDNLEHAIPLYQELTGETEVRRFPYRDLELALVGPFLLYSGPLEKYVSQNGTVIVGSLAPVLEALGKAGAEILEAPNEVPNGTRIVARHPDGSVFEYTCAGHPLDVQIAGGGGLGRPDDRPALTGRRAG
ncbi:VOC family protein, partial [Streptomyces sp. 900116325]